MKIKFFLIAGTIVLAGIQQQAGAQTLYTTVTGASTNTFTGINTNAPVGRLEIKNDCVANTSPLLGGLVVTGSSPFGICSPSSGVRDNFIVRSQTTSSGYRTDFIVKQNSGRVGIGTNNPSSQLHVNGGGMTVSNTTNTSSLNFFSLSASQEVTSSNNLNFNVTGNTNFLNGTTSRFYIGSNGKVGINTATPSDQFVINNVGVSGCGLQIISDKPDWSYGLLYKYTGTGNYHSAIAVNDNAGDNRFNVYTNGMTIIGKVTNPAGLGVADPAYMLQVDNGILTEKVKVALQADWADYVFEKSYKRNSLTEVEQFIKENKHLPNVPSACEVKENGIDMATMDETLLRQIEELWLHVIDLKKENEALKAELSKK